MSFIDGFNAANAAEKAEMLERLVAEAAMGKTLSERVQVLERQAAVSNIAILQLSAIVEKTTKALEAAEKLTALLKSQGL